jgi:Protein of unknown function (DUF4235)
MGKLVFLPISLGGGLLAGVIGKKLFDVIWGLIDDQDSPKPEHRNVHVGKLLIALTIEGPVLSLIRGVINHGSRHAYTRLAGSWPGDEQPEAD